MYTVTFINIIFGYFVPLRIKTFHVVGARPWWKNEVFVERQNGGEPMFYV